MSPEHSPVPREGPASPPPSIEFGPLLKKVQAYRPHDDIELLRRAYAFSAEKHKEQTRLSGEPFLSHPLAVAHTLADLKLDVVALCAGLLHDIVEDTVVPLETIRQEFGSDVAHVVEGLTKISRLDFSSREAHQAENVRKMLLAMVDDVRVVLVKLADRLHNMRTIRFLPPEKQQAVARETLEIYAPIAHRLGMGRIRGELEDLGFAVLEPEAYLEMRKQVESKRKVSEKFLEEVRGVIGKKMRENGIPCAVEGRIKRLYSIYQKIKRQQVTLDQVYDLLAVRLVTDTVNNCYAALGVIHQIWRPIPGRIKDYIAMPRPNLYQSLHTSVISTSGQPFEVQIRTQEMHHLAEFGIAAHWKYKDGKKLTARDDERIQWLRQLIDWAKEMQDPSEFFSTLKIDLYPEEVYTFTPKGKVVVLPRGAAPVDFAYAIHTEVGHSCVGAKVNGRIVPLRYKLRTGDIVEILTQSGHIPSRDWLTFARSSRARNKIKQWINVHEHQKANELGHKLLEKEARRFHFNLKKVSEADLERAAHDYGCRKTDELYTAIGYGKVSTRAVLQRLSPEPLAEPAAEKPSRLASAVRRVLGVGDGTILVKGHNDLMVYRAKCCNPIRGEEVVGYITRGKGVAVHSKNCSNVQNLLYETERRIDVAWAKAADDSYPVRLSIRTEDRPGLLKEITAAISDDKLNIKNIEARSDALRAVIDVTVDIQDVKQLERIVTTIKKINGVFAVERVQR